MLRRVVQGPLSGYKKVAVVWEDACVMMNLIGPTEDILQWHLLFHANGIWFSFRKSWLKFFNISNYISYDTL